MMTPPVMVPAKRAERIHGREEGRVKSPEARNPATAYGRRRKAFPALPAVLAAALCAFALITLATTSQVHARTLEVLGASATAQPSARFLVREAPSAYKYESLKLLEISLAADGAAQWTTLVPEKQAQRYQHGGVFDLHRANLEKKESETRDESELLGFQKAEEVSCFTIQVEAKSTPVHLEPGGRDHGYAWTCVLASGTTPTARLLLEVQKEATMIHFAPNNQQPVIRVARIPHLLVDLTHRGKRALPVIALSRAYRIPQGESQKFAYLLVFERSRPLVADLAPQNVLVMVHPDALLRPDGGLIATR